MIKKFLSVALAGLLIFCLNSQNISAQTNAANQKQSAAVVQSFYEFHRSRSGVFNASEVNLRKKWFSGDLNKLFANELRREKEFLKKNPDEKPFFGDGFPFQPYDECAPDGKSIKNTFKVGETSENKNKMIVEVSFYTPKECGENLIDTYKIELVKNKRNWLINDWFYSDGKSLSQDLKRADY